MSKYHYSKYKIIIDPESKKVQGLRPGDVVRRQYADSANLIYSLMVVLETGTDVIQGKDSHYFIGALVEGNEPRNGELLDFVRITNLSDRERGGAMYLTASDADSPYLNVIDGMAAERSLLFQKGSRRIEAGQCFDFPVNGKVAYPERMVIWFRIRASKAISGAPLVFGYGDGGETDGTDTVEVSAEWQYKLSLISIDYPSRYERKLTVSPALSGDEWCELEDLNVVRLSDIAAFSGATKARVGKITGVTDPVFGVLEGYGAYFQNLYATKNVNIAGTLTAGDENGFASTFYVGKIHKNVILDSTSCLFSESAITDGPAPAGIGNVVRTGGNTQIAVQSAVWRTEHHGQQFSFSVWVKSGTGVIAVYQDEHRVGEIEITVSGEWRRYKVSFVIEPSAGDALYIRLESALTELLVSAPQMESGANVSQYQPTDGVLDYTEDYGAWFSKGGIGGTIQHPLLKLNEDGSVSSRDGSFVINQDGTGHFAGGRFRWTKDNIELSDMAIRWGDMDDETKENLISQSGAYSVEIVTSNGNNFIGGDIETTLTAHVFKGSEEITDSLSNNLFNWRRASHNADGDIVWNEQHTGFGKLLAVTQEDVSRRATFTCEVLID